MGAHGSDALVCAPPVCAPPVRREPPRLPQLWASQPRIMTPASPMTASSKATSHGTPLRASRSDAELYITPKAQNLASQRDQFKQQASLILRPSPSTSSTENQSSRTGCRYT